MIPAAEPMSDVVVLVPDLDIEVVLQSLLVRHGELGIRSIRHDVFRHHHRDPGCANRAHEFLRPLIRQYNYCLVCLDHEGSGRESSRPAALREQVRDSLERNGWAGRCEVVVFVPEVETWIWGDPSAAAATFAHGQDARGLRSQLADLGLWSASDAKPRRPKEAVEQVLRLHGMRRSSSLYAAIAQRSSFQTCTDPEFGRLRMTLQNWFPPVS
jgi:hypothetical protein